MSTAPLPKSAELPIGACANANELIVVKAVTRPMVANLILRVLLIEKETKTGEFGCNLQSGARPEHLSVVPMCRGLAWQGGKRVAERLV